MFDNNNIKEYLKGFVVGSTQTIIGHPFDTAKTNMQANRKINLLKLHRGITFPLVSNSLINSVLFGSFHDTLVFDKLVPSESTKGSLVRTLVTFNKPLAGTFLFGV